MQHPTYIAWIEMSTDPENSEIIHYKTEDALEGIGEIVKKIKILPHGVEVTRDEDDVIFIPMHSVSTVYGQ